MSLSILAGASACTNKMPRSFNTTVRASYPKTGSGMPPPPRNCLATEYVVFIIAEIKAAARDVYQIKSPALHTNQKRARGSSPDIFSFAKLTGLLLVSSRNTHLL